MINKSIFIFGYGYVAAALTRKLLTQGWKIAVATRNHEKAKELRRLGITVFNYTEMEAPIGSYTHLLHSIPPIKGGEVVLLKHGRWITSQPWQWIGHLSSTGVYGDHAGEWVTEESAFLPPRTLRVQLREEAENSWLKLWQNHSLPVHLFRLAAIYGPGRGIQERLKHREIERVIKAEGHYFSRIHVEDIASLLKASMESPMPGAIYNVADDEPAPQSAVLEYAAELMNLPLPATCSLEDANLSPSQLEFWQNNRRISNAKIKKDLGIALAYPSYREGLSNLISPQKKRVNI